jgi:hypothetical protein
MPLERDLTADVGSDAVEFSLTITNGSTEPVEVTYQSGCHADFAVRDRGSDEEREVWRWSNGRMFTQALETEALAPGESVRYVARWEDPTPGEYDAVANLEATDADIEERTAFTV